MQSLCNTSVFRDSRLGRSSSHLSVKYSRTRARRGMASSSGQDLAVDLCGLDDMFDLVGVDVAQGSEPPVASNVKDEFVGDSQKRPLVKTEDDPTTPAKRGRFSREASGEMASSPGEVPAETAIVKSQNAKAEHCSVKSEGNDTDGCHGCFRAQGVSPSFTGPEELVEWALRGKGRWCKDCWMVWRTVYQDQHCLTFFSEFLQADDANRQTFWEYIIALNTLKVEDCQQMNLQRLDSRFKMLRWLYRLLCIHPSQNMIVPLVDALQEGSPHLTDALAPRNLITMLVGGVPQLGGQNIPSHVVVERRVDHPTASTDRLDLCSMVDATVSSNGKC